MHTALWVLAITSLVGAGVSLLRPSGKAATEGRESQPAAIADRAPA